MVIRPTIEDVMRLIRAASNPESFVNVYVTPEGEIEARKEEVRVPFLEKSLPVLLQSLGIVPRNKWRPDITQYKGGTYDDLQYTVTRDEAQRVAEAFGVSLDAAPAPSASAPAVAPPEPVAAPAEAVPVLGAGVVKHTTKTRRDPLAAVFARAKSEATDSTCPYSVWAALVAMATGNYAPPELTDYRDDRGLQATGARGGWLSKSAFLDRWRRGRV